MRSLLPVVVSRGPTRVGVGPDGSDRAVPPPSESLLYRCVGGDDGIVTYVITVTLNLTDGNAPPPPPPLPPLTPPRNTKQSGQQARMQCMHAPSIQNEDLAKTKGLSPNRRH